MSVGRVVERKKKSWTWAYFSPDDTKPKSRGSSFVTCTLCSASIEIKDFSSNYLANHLKLDHEIFKPRKEKSGKDTNETCSKEKQNECDKYMSRFIATSHSALLLVEDENFQKFVHTLNPSYKLPSRETLRNSILQESKLVSEKIFEQVKGAESISYCTDLWKSKARDYYVSVTVQFIDRDWKLKNLPVAYKKIIGSHTAQSVGNFVADCLKPCLGNGQTPFAGVIDGGDIASIKHTALNLNCKIKDQTCICHQLNNVIKRIVNDYMEDRFLLSWRTFIKRIRKSNPFRELWVECCQQFYGKEIILQSDTPTRWSSTVSMAYKSLSVKQAAERMFNITNTDALREHHEFVPDWGPSLSSQWILLEKIVNIFKPTLDIISYLEGQKYITESVILLQLCNLEISVDSLMEQYPEPSNRELHVIMKDFKEEINGLWDKLPLDTVIASILDPRTKFFDRIPKDEMNEALDTLKEELVELVNKNPIPAESNQRNNILDGLFSAVQVRATTPLDIWNNEINSFRNETRPPMSSDPLDWWKGHQCRYPYLSKLARAYLGIPASQASCERLFSVAKDDITDKRCSLQPDIVEAFIFISSEKNC